MVKGGLDYISQKIKRSFHNSWKTKWAFHVSQKKRTFFFKQKLHTITFWKITSKACKASLVVVTFCPLCVLRDAKRKPSLSFCISWMTPSFLKILKSLGCGTTRKTGFLLINQYFLLPSVKKKYINTVTFWSPQKSHWWTWCSAIMVEIDETEVIANQINHVVARNNGCQK